MARVSKVPPEMRERAVRLLDGIEEHGSKWQSIKPVAAKMGFHPRDPSARGSNSSRSIMAQPACDKG